MVTKRFVIKGEIKVVIISPKAALRMVMMARAPQAPKNTINLLYLMAMIIARKKVLSPIQLTRIAKNEVVKPDRLSKFQGSLTSSLSWIPSNQSAPMIIFEYYIYLDMKKSQKVILVLMVVNCCLGLNLKIIDPVYEDEQGIIYENDELRYNYDDEEYNNMLSCQNGGLQFVEYKIQNTSNVVISYQDINISSQNIIISVEPNEMPSPSATLNTANSQIIVNRNCPSADNINEDNYYNKVTMNLYDEVNKKNYRFSFLLNCDEETRHKKFEVGYLLIALINAFIIIGVAVFSKIWSIKYHDQPIYIQLKWYRFLFLTIILLVISLALFFFAKDHEFMNANIILRYLGLCISTIFVFICFDELFFLISPFKKTAFRFIRVCDILSSIVTLIFFIVSILQQNWILYDFLAICICVAGIKLLRFTSLKQALYSFIISVLSTTIISIILHYILPRSYNDYASELSSPLFITLPDLINNLFKKCSWLPVIDVIVPGVLLSYLRKYDENFHTGLGGVYTVVGNLAFILSTGLWIILEALYPFSIPFSLITYSFLFVAIILTSFKRNELKTLWQGRFNTGDSLTSSFLKEERLTFGKMVEKDMIDDVKAREDESQQ